MDFDVVVYNVNQFQAVMRRNRLMPPVFTNITAHPTLNSNLQPPVVLNNTSPMLKLVPKSQVECRGRLGWVPQQCFSIGKENQNPNIFSSLLNQKLEQVSLFSSDFQDPLSKQRFRNLVVDAGDLLLEPRKKQK